MIEPDLFYGLSAAQLEYFKILGNIKLAGITASALSGIKLFAIFYIFILSVIEQKISDIHAFGKLAGILYSGMMLFIGLEKLSFGIKAKGLMQKPCTVSDISGLAFTVRLVTAAGEP